MAACSNTQWSKNWCFTVVALLKIQQFNLSELELNRDWAARSDGGPFKVYVCMCVGCVCVHSGVFSAYFPLWGEDLAHVCVGLILLILSDRQMRHICDMLTAGIQCILHLSKPFDQRWALNRDSLLEKGVALHFWAQTFTPGFYFFSFYFFFVLSCSSSLIISYYYNCKSTATISQFSVWVIPILALELHSNVAFMTPKDA